MSEEEKAELEELYENSEWWHNRFNAVQRDYEELKTKIDRAISFIHLLKNNLKDYTEYEEYTKIFNEMLNDILEILGDKENVN